MGDTLLVIDDEPARVAELCHHYRHGGWEPLVAHSVRDAEAQLTGAADAPLVVLVRGHLVHGDVVGLREVERARGGCAEWIVLGGAQPMLPGACNVPEPWSTELLDDLVSAAARGARAHRRLRELGTAAARAHDPTDFVGTSAAARAVRELASRMGREPVAVLLLTGESGTGKNHAARILHYAGADPEAALITLHCARMSAGELERVLFAGKPHAGKAGRGLVEQARGGTLFLDRVERLGTHLQERVLHAVDRTLAESDGHAATGMRLIASSVADPATLNPDLYRRAAGRHLHLPPLRERREDLDALVPRFLAKYSARAGVPTPEIPAAVWGELRGYDWPGNAHELRNAIERALLCSADGHLASPGVDGMRPDHVPAVSGERLYLPLDGAMSLNEMDRFIILTALERSGFNVTAAARTLGTTRETLRYRIHKYGLRNGAPSPASARNPSIESGS